MLMTSGLNHGIKKSIPHLLGITIGFPAMVLAIAFGLNAIFIYYPVTHQIINLFGMLYMLYLAWKIANASNPRVSENLRKPLGFWQAVAFQWVNPKAWVIALGAIAAYTSAETFAADVLGIMLAFFSVGSACMVFWLGLGVSLQDWLKNDRQLRVFNMVMALLLVLSIFSMAFMDS